MRQDSINGMAIVARKPRPDGGEYIVVAREPHHGTSGRFVSASLPSEQAARHTEWYWGHYFDTLEDAMAHFNGR